MELYNYGRKRKIDKMAVLEKFHSYKVGPVVTMANGSRNKKIWMKEIRNLVDTLSEAAILSKILGS